MSKAVVLGGDKRKPVRYLQDKGIFFRVSELGLVGQVLWLKGRAKGSMSGLSVESVARETTGQVLV